MFEQSFLRRTGQMWKFICGICVFVAGGVLILYSAIVPTVADTSFALTLCGGFLLWAVGASFVCLSVRCPRCASRVVIASLGRTSVFNAGGAVLAMLHCPNCGYPVD
jgi:hypothetical protein